MNLYEYSDQELQDEIQRRKQLAADKPKQLSEIDTTEIVRQCNRYIDFIAQKPKITYEMVEAYYSDIALVALFSVFGQDVKEYIMKKANPKWKLTTQP